MDIYNRLPDDVKDIVDLCAWLYNHKTKYEDVLNQLKTRQYYCPRCTRQNAWEGSLQQALYLILNEPYIENTNNNNYDDWSDSDSSVDIDIGDTDEDGIEVELLEL
jgi:hypothetical protein